VSDKAEGLALRRRNAAVAIHFGIKFIMLNGKLRIAPTCYHVLHLIPVTSAHKMGFFYDEGLKSDDGAPAYNI